MARRIQKEQLLKPRIFLLKHLRLDKLSWVFFQHDRRPSGSHWKTNRGFHSEGLTFPNVSVQNCPTVMAETNSASVSPVLRLQTSNNLKQLMSLQRPCSKVIERCSHPSFNTLEVIIAIEGMGSLLMNHRNMWRLRLIATQVAIGLVRLAHQHNGPSMEILCDETFQKVLASVPARAIRCEDAKCPEIQVMTLNDIP